MDEEKPKTIGDILRTLTPEQRDVMAYIIGREVLRVKAYYEEKLKEYKLDMEKQKQSKEDSPTKISSITDFMD